MVEQLCRTSVVLNWLVDLGPARDLRLYTIAIECAHIQAVALVKVIK